MPQIWKMLNNGFLRNSFQSFLSYLCVNIFIVSIVHTHTHKTKQRKKQTKNAALSISITFNLFKVEHSVLGPGYLFIIKTGKCLH